MTGNRKLHNFPPAATGGARGHTSVVLLVAFRAFRLLNEEKILREQMPGCSEYCQRTRFRLVFFVW